MTLWRPSQNKDHLVDYDNKKVIKGTKTFEELIDAELDANSNITAQERTQLKQKHRNRKVVRR